MRTGCRIASFGQSEWRTYYQTDTVKVIAMDSEPKSKKLPNRASAIPGRAERAAASGAAVVFSFVSSGNIPSRLFGDRRIFS
jgi:hypothetical protein